MGSIGPFDLKSIKAFIIDWVSSEIASEVENLHLVSNFEKKFYEASLRVHPLSKILYTFDIDSEKSRKEGRLHLSGESFKIIQMYDDLLTLKENNDIQRIISSINVPKSFYSGLFELLIAASYNRMGYNVEILEESDNRTPDFKVTSDLSSFYVECKSLENKSRNAEAVWERVSRRVNKVASLLEWQLGVTIMAKDYITNSQADELVEYLQASLKAPCNRKLNFDHSVVYVNFLAPYNDERPFKKIEFSALDLGRVEFSLRKVGDIDYVSQLSYINVKGFFSGNYVKQAKRLFKKAMSQLPHNEFSVLHLEIPHGSQKEFIPSIDAIYPKIYDILNRKSGHINSVIISAIPKDPVVVKESASIIQEHVIVPRLKFNSINSENIELLGSNDSLNILDGIKNNPSEGTVFFEFILDRPLQSKLGCYIFSAVSGNGEHQVKIGLVSEQKIRVEVVTPKVGHLMCDYISSNIIREKSTNKMAISFEVGAIKTALNGIILPADQKV